MADIYPLQNLTHIDIIIPTDLRVDIDFWVSQEIRYKISYVLDSYVVDNLAHRLRVSLREELDAWK